ncbi:hypothetical protein [Roseibium aggregatum]|nr:hypothetical protein [Roseibium aggregatum]
MSDYYTLTSAYNAVSKEKLENVRDWYNQTHGTNVENIDGAGNAIDA